MTDLRTRLEFGLLFLSIAVFIFFTPFLMGKKQPAIKGSVIQNMEFMREIAQKYLDNNKKTAPNLETLLAEAQSKHFNKTLFNPILKESGDMTNRQLIIPYSETLYRSLGKSFQGFQYAGKTGYYQDGLRFAIYGHLAQGELLTDENGNILVFTNK